MATKFLKQVSESLTMGLEKLLEDPEAREIPPNIRYFNEVDMSKFSKILGFTAAFLHRNQIQVTK